MPDRIHEHATSPDAAGPVQQRGWRLLVKRGLDVTAASAALAVSAPLLLGVAGLIRSTMGAPVLFRQPRPGRRGRIFTAYKFRTMRDARGPDGKPLPDGARLTPVGRFVRRTSLDELPQLLNVLRGEMSIVGPRPLLVQYLPRYSADQLRRHDVLPGITGWAQVCGRNATTWPERFAQDLWYVDHWSLGLDLKILALTVRKVLAGEGISQPGAATMPEFMGPEFMGDEG